jgi:8-oxo-dGTP pyrophosphatase MutT (NUDIX family)
MLLREPSLGRLEILLVARRAESRAFGGAHVFPGGLVDAADRAPLLLAAAAGGDPDSKSTATTVAAKPMLAFRIAAIRELFEEAGVLLAESDGQPLRFDDASVRDRFGCHRQALLAGTRSFADIVAEERLRLCTDALLYFSRWITPTHAPRRYDAHFFVARAPAHQAPLHDERETTSAEWWTPADALAAAAAGSMVLTPPTARTLEELVELGTLEHVRTSASSRPVTPILPKVVQIGDRMGVLYPGDVDYDATEPGQAIPAERSGTLNRVVMDDAGWRRFRGLRSD